MTKSKLSVSISDMKRYNSSKPFITDADKKSVMDVLSSDHLSLGPKVEEFEKKFADRIGTKYSCAVSSGTAGLHLAMIAAGIKEGDEVITSPFSFVASANSIMYVGAKPVFVDIDPMTFNMDPSKVEEKVTERTRAILVVHIFGQPSDMDSILKIAKKYDLKIIEDACESILAQYKGKNVGTFGESAVFAFYPNKQMTTGEGGMIVTNKKDVYDLCLSLRNQGRAQDMQWLDHIRLGYNYRMDEMSAALGISQLGKIDFLIDKRREVAGWYSELFSPYKDVIQLPQTAEFNTHTWFVYVVTLRNNNLERDKVIRALLKEEIHTKPYLPSIHLFDFYKRRFGYKKGDFPISEQVSDTSIALPFYVGLTREDVQCIKNRFINIIDSLL